MLSLRFGIKKVKEYTAHDVIAKVLNCACQSLVMSKGLSIYNFNFFASNWIIEHRLQHYETCQTSLGTSVFCLRFDFNTRIEF